MIRPRTFSAAARMGPDPSRSSVESSFLTLSNATSHDRAIDNDYCESPLSFRPLSAPTDTGIFHSNRNASRETDRLLNRDAVGTRDRVTEGWNSHSRTHRDRQRSRRNGLPFPGSASRVTNLSASLPANLLTRELSMSCQNALDRKPNPHVPPRSYSSTIGHLPPRSNGDVLCKSNQSLVQPMQNLNYNSSSNLYVPPPRPPKPSTEVAARLGLIAEVPQDSHNDTVASFSVRTMQPRRMSADPQVRTAIVSPPLSQCPPVIPPKSESIRKKSLVVEFTAEESTKTRTSSVSKHKSRESTSKSDSSLKKEINSTLTLNSESDNGHELLGPGIDSTARPGEHNYPCPRCGKCMCPRCKRGNLDSTINQSRSHPYCWGCDGRCFCNADACVETVTCLCCVRACFYHCSDYEEDGECTDKPCSCRSANWCCRWSAIGALSLILPCLMCYPVARGCLKLCRTCSDCIRPGCRCREADR